MRILTVMGAVYNGLEGYAFSGINTLGNSGCTVVFSVSVSKTGSYTNSTSRVTTNQTLAAWRRASVRQP